MSAAIGRRPGVPPSDEAVSSVLGAILVFALFVITLVTIQVRYVPVWDRDREAALMDTSLGQLAQVRSDLDRMAQNRTSAPTAAPLTLASSSGFRFFSGSHFAGEASFAPPPSGQGIQVTSPQVHLVSQGGRSLFAGSETWIAVSGGGSVTDVVAVEHLRLRVSTPAAWRTGDSVTLTLLGPGNAYAGKFVLTNIDHGPSYTFEYQTYAAASATAPISIVQDSFEKGKPPPYQYVDLLRPDLLWRDVLAAAPTPFSIQFTRQNMQSDYTIVYMARTGTGATRIGNPGIAVPDFDVQLASGTLRVDHRNQRLADQDFTVEHGAVLVTQPDGQAMLVPPAFAAELVGGQLHVRWTVPALWGEASAVAGASQVTVLLEPTGVRTDLVATAARLSFTVTTSAPGAWAAFWADTLSATGLAAAGSGPPYRIVEGATSVTLELFGYQSDPASTTEDIVLSLSTATIGTSVRAAATGG